MDAGLLDCWAAGIGDLVQISFVGPRSLHVLMRSRAVVQRLVFIVSCSSSIIQSMLIIKSLGAQRAARRICTCCANTTAADLLPPL